MDDPELNLAKISHPTKMYLNSKENILVIESSKYVGVVNIEPDVSLVHSVSEMHIEIIGYESVAKLATTGVDVVMQTQFHPLSPYSLCILKDPS